MFGVESFNYSTDFVSKCSCRRFNILFGLSYGSFSHDCNKYQQNKNTQFISDSQQKTTPLLWWRTVCWTIIPLWICCYSVLNDTTTTMTTTNKFKNEHQKQQSIYQHQHQQQIMIIITITQIQGCKLEHNLNTLLQQHIN